MPIHVTGPDEGEQSGGGPVRCRIIEDGSHTHHHGAVRDRSGPLTPRAVLRTLGPSPWRGELAPSQMPERL